MTGTREAPLYVTVSAEDSDALSRLTELVTGSDGGVRVVGIFDPESDRSDPVMMEFGEIPDKQWEALSHAAELGHYSGKRGGNVGEIAARLGVSDSAVSQRLRAAEAKIISQVIGASDR